MKRLASFLSFTVLLTSLLTGCAGSGTKTQKAEVPSSKAAIVEAAPPAASPSMTPAVQTMPVAATVPATKIQTVRKETKAATAPQVVSSTKAVTVPVKGNPGVVATKVAVKPVTTPRTQPVTKVVVIPRTVPRTIPKTTPVAVEKSDYVLNHNTLVYHRPGCRHVKKIKDGNKEYFRGTPEELARRGFRPCKACKP